MRRNKKVMMLLSFCLGAAIFITTAFADVVSKTGYDQLKDAIKYTAGSLSKDYDSFTMQAEYLLKDNDKTLVSTTATAKYDVANDRRDDVTTTEFANGKKESRYVYWDRKCHITYNVEEDKYYVNEYAKEQEDVAKIDNPFEEERVQDFEKIFDALVGNLKEHVIVEENSDGSKEFSGSISDSQIPALVNAVSAYFFKQTVVGPNGSYGLDIPQLVDDVFVKKVSGRASTNKDGLMENLFATVILSGKDKDGVVHDLTVEAIMKLININSTEITKPDLEGKEVAKSKIQNSVDKFITNKFLGKWKNDIVIEENDTFKKIGERTIEITSIDDKFVYGKYSESYKEEYADYESNKKEFEFKAELDHSRGGRFESIGSSDKKEGGYINFDTGRVTFHLDFVKLRVDGEFNKEIFNDPFFSKVFEE